MAKKKIYAVRKGKTTGIFQNWSDCKASVDGYPGAEFRGFFTMEEAREYLGEATTNGQATETKEEQGVPDQVVAYVDGSFDVKIGRYSFGCILLLPDGEIIRQSGNGNNPECVALRNVTGEMLGAMYAVQWCVQNEYSSVKICYDYAGIEMWATGGWKAKNELTQKYAEYMRTNGKRIAISFQKIAAHTGDYYNEEADKLAKAALTDANGVPKVVKREAKS